MTEQLRSRIAETSHDILNFLREWRDGLMTEENAKTEIRSGAEKIIKMAKKGK